MISPPCAKCSRGIRDRCITVQPLRSWARLWEQLPEYFEVRFRAEKYVVTYFLAESEAKQSGPRKEAVGARARNTVEDLSGADPRSGA
jgi:hypothetical protein